MKRNQTLISLQMTGRMTTHAVQNCATIRSSAQLHPTAKAPRRTHHPCTLRRELGPLQRRRLAPVCRCGRRGKEDKDRVEGHGEKVAKEEQGLGGQSGDRSSEVSVGRFRPREERDARGQQSDRASDRLAAELKVLEAAVAEDSEVGVWRGCKVGQPAPLFPPASLAPSAPNKSYSAILSTLTTPARCFLSQCHVLSRPATSSQSSRLRTPSCPHPRCLVRSTASCSATVIPPPVSGCRMFQLSPTMITPSRAPRRPCILGGR